MTMADQGNVSRVITTFLLNSCRLLPRITERNLQAALTSILMDTKKPAGDEKAAFIPLITGSVAEFYIEPMLPFVGDIDLMFHNSSELAIPRGHPPPTQLPAEFHNYVYVGEIIGSHLPGYVYLPIRYLLTRFTNNNNYNYTECDKTTYLLNTKAYTIDKKIFMDQLCLMITANHTDCQLMLYLAYVVLRGRHKPLIGQHDAETTAGQTQQLLIELSVTDVTWLVWHIVSVDNMNGWASVSGDCHFHEQKLY